MPHGLHDALVSGAGAEVSVERAAELLLAGIRIPLDEVLRDEKHPGRAEAALHRMALQEAFLEGVEAGLEGALLPPRLRGEPFNGDDRRTVGLHREARARLHG